MFEMCEIDGFILSGNAILSCVLLLRVLLLLLLLLATEVAATGY